MRIAGTPFSCDGLLPLLRKGSGGLFLATPRPEGQRTDKGARRAPLLRDLRGEDIFFYGLSIPA